ncbi:MAG TPA: hypothetical protein DCS67_00565 [Clostridiales bacterium UBA8960]|nr:hypothetical protein [Clostridiales bacterium UBA8960]
MDQTFIIEKDYLKRTKRIAKEQIHLLKETSEKVKADIIEQKREMREEAKHSISSNLNSSDNFDQLVALSQFATQTMNTIDQYESNMKKIEQLEKFMHRPYFARVDFKFDDDAVEEKIYIGRYSIMNEPDFDRLVYDWRAPISSLFYRYGTGPAFYEAPVGKISGELKLKRQYEIKNGELEYYFDADMQILDDFLRKMLTHNASHQMKSIVETIQRDQDLIIRNMKSDLMMVQGVAGSGKTSVALHRVAYLMYHGLKNRLTSQNIIIISPNALFEKYISQVLPELGEENVASFLFDDLYDMVLNRPFETKNQLYEFLLSSVDPIRKKNELLYKMNSEFIDRLNDVDIRPNMPVDKIMALYFQIVKDPEALNDTSIRYEDASAIVYLYLRSNGYDDYRHIKHVVVDEAQDYYQIHFEILKLMFPGAQFTVLGDINQTIEKHEKLSFYELVKSTLRKKNTSLVSMDKSFRSAHEILEFSTRFVDTEIKSYSRHCEVPQLIKRDKVSDFMGLISEIERCKELGYASIGILCKTEDASIKLFEQMHSKIELSLVQSQSRSDLTGTFVLPIYLSKGLEFDAVIVWDVDDVHYHTREDKQLLYIACTRALHRLNLFYFGEVSPLCL